MLLTPAVLQALQTTFSMQFRQGYGDTTPWSPMVSTQIPSTVRTNTYGWMARIMAMREWLGPRVLQNLEAHSYTITNRDFEVSVGVDRNDIEDDNLGIYNPLIQEMGRAARKWPDQLMRTTLQAGATTGLGFDGLSFFNDAHTLDPGGTQDNNFAGTALTLANYATVREAMMAYTGEDGEPLGVVPYILVIPPQLEQIGKEILEAALILDTTATAAVTNVQQGSAKLLMVPELANEATTWYLADSSRPIKPLVFQQRKAPQFVPKVNPSDDNVFFDKEFIWGTDSRGNGGNSLWFLMARAISARFSLSLLK